MKISCNKIHVGLHVITAELLAILESNMRLFCGQNFEHEYINENEEAKIHVVWETGSNMS